jgi:hypothetical protein
MTPWTFNVKFLYDTQFLFRSLMFATGEDRNLELLTRGQHQAILNWFTKKLCIIRPIHHRHQDQATLVQV